MDKYIYDDKNGLWYDLQGDYYIPCLILPAEKTYPAPACQCRQGNCSTCRLQEA